MDQGQSEEAVNGASGKRKRSGDSQKKQTFRGNSKQRDQGRA